MAWFSRGKSSQDEVAEAAAGPSRYPAPDESLIGEDGLGPLRPKDRGLGDQERERVQSALAALAADGTDVADIDALSAAYDREYLGWRETGKKARANHDVIVEKYAIGLGEHLANATDLQWRVVTDIFGTDLALADRREGDFVVVPGNLVASRWMRGETGWLPGVARHLIGLRAST